MSTTATVAATSSLAEHAAEIRRLGKLVIAEVIEIGQRLKLCKDICGHGNYLPWLEREFGWTERTALNFMRVAELSNSKRISDLNLPLGGLYLLAAPSTPDEARDQIIERAKGGEAVSTNTIKQTITKARKPEAEQPVRRAVYVADMCGSRYRITHDGRLVDKVTGELARNDTDDEAADDEDHEAAADDEQPKRSLVTGVAMAPHAERGLDLYETPPAAVRALLDAEDFAPPIWEPACGPGAIVRVLRDAGYGVVATDIKDYGCPDALGGVDFLLESNAPKGVQTIITNPPYRLANKFVRHALTLAPKVIMLLPLRFLEGEGRSDILDDGHLLRVHIFRNRLPMMHRAGWDGPRIKSGAIAFAWFVWRRSSSPNPQLNRISWRAEPPLPAAAAGTAP
jgi:hypothetical protein